MLVIRGWMEGVLIMTMNYKTYIWPSHGSVHVKSMKTIRRPSHGSVH